MLKVRDNKQFYIPKSLYTWEVHTYDGLTTCQIIMLTCQIFKLNLQTFVLEESHVVQFLMNSHINDH